MERFVRSENIKHCRQMLERTTDAMERQRIQTLLDEELHKQASAENDEHQAKRA